jgi:hypothetical protein
MNPIWFIYCSHTKMLPWPSNVQLRYTTTFRQFFGKPPLTSSISSVGTVGWLTS